MDFNRAKKNGNWSTEESLNLGLHLDKDPNVGSLFILCLYKVTLMRPKVGRPEDQFNRMYFSVVCLSFKQWQRKMFYLVIYLFPINDLTNLEVSFPIKIMYIHLK